MKPAGEGYKYTMHAGELTISANGKRTYRFPPGDISRVRVIENAGDEFCWKDALGGHVRRRLNPQRIINFRGFQCWYLPLERKNEQVSDRRVAKITVYYASPSLDMACAALYVSSRVCIICELTRIKALKQYTLFYCTRTCTGNRHFVCPSTKVSTPSTIASS